MAYDPNVIDAFGRALDETGASARVRKALILAGIQESGLQNLGYGDRDSLGALQQRPSQGWKHATDPYKGALDFLDQAIALNSKGFHGSAGELAQAVQRSAYPDRYDAHSAQADSILAQLGGGASSPAPSGSTQSAGGAAPAASPVQFDPGQAGDFTSLLASLSSKPQQQPVSTPIAAPSFSAQPAMPSGFQGLSPSPAPANDAQGGVSAALSLLDGLRGSGPTVGASDGSGGADGSQTALIAQTVQQDRTTTQRAKGKVIVAAGANRAGVGLSDKLMTFAQRVAGQYGKPITIGTGTAHNQYVVGTHRESAHWRGNGADIPASGDTLTRLGQDALIAAGMPAAEARKQKGGLFNVGGYQVIFNSMTGGNHFGHLHIGVR